MALLSLLSHPFLNNVNSYMLLTRHDYLFILNNIYLYIFRTIIYTHDIYI